MNKKGFSIIDLLIVIAVITFLIPPILVFIAQKTGSLIKEFKQEATPEVVTETVTIDRSGVTCQDGKKVIEIDGVVYHLGLIKNTWGDLTPVDCQ